MKGDLLTLTIHNAQPEDQGNYRCLVDNQHTDATLTVERTSFLFLFDTSQLIPCLLALPILFTKYLPKTWTVSNGEPLELSCHLSKANVRVVWLKDGVPIDDRSQMRNEGLRYSLDIPHGIEPGRYTIRIGDLDGLESSCQVSVEGSCPLLGEGRSLISTLVSDSAENERKKPRIIRELADVTLEEGQALELTCEFEGNEVEATWFFDGVMLRSNLFTTINFKPNQLAQLLMKEMFTEDAGLYKLRLKNQYGEATSTCLVSIRRSESLQDQRKSAMEDLPPK